MKADLVNELKCQILELAIEVNEPKISGVYFLIKKDEIVYVGKSENIYDRVKKHINNPLIDFDKWYCLLYEDSFVCKEREMYFIEILKPKYNMQNNPDYENQYILGRNLVVNDNPDIDKSKINKDMINESLKRHNKDVLLQRVTTLSI